MDEFGCTTLNRSWTIMSLINVNEKVHVVVISSFFFNFYSLIIVFLKIDKLKFWLDKRERIVDDDIPHKKQWKRSYGGDVEFFFNFYVLIVFSFFLFRFWGWTNGNFGWTSVHKRILFGFFKKIWGWQLHSAFLSAVILYPNHGSNLILKWTRETSEIGKIAFMDVV